MFEEQVNTTAGHGLTVTVKLQLVLLPHASQAMQVTVVVPSGKVLPLGGLHVTVTGPPGQPPVAELLKKTTAEFEQGAAKTVIVLEQWRVSEAVLLDGARNAIVPGPVIEGDQVLPPSRLTSVKTSKKL